MMDRSFNKQFYDSLLKEVDNYSLLPVYNESFGSYATRILKRKKMSRTDLSIETGVTMTMISNYFNKNDVELTPQYVIALIMGLEMESPQIEAALKLADVRIDNPTRRNQIIQYCLDRCSRSGDEKRTVTDCNRMLYLSGFKPLTTKGLKKEDLNELENLTE